MMPVMGVARIFFGGGGTLFQKNLQKIFKKFKKIQKIFKKISKIFNKFSTKFLYKNAKNWFFHHIFQKI